MSYKRRKRKNHEPILFAVFTAVLAAILSVIGFYFNSKIQVKNDRIQKQLEYKASAYSSFLTFISRSNSPIIAEILCIGELPKHIVTDFEIQTLENSFERLVNHNEEYGLSWQLDIDFNILRLHGSESVQKNCDDILTVLALRESSVDWTQYPEELQSLRKTWLENQNGEPYGYELKVTDDERVMFILLSALYKNLLNQLRFELQN